jgi:hypothetical protein
MTLWGECAIEKLSLCQLSLKIVDTRMKSVVLIIKTALWQLVTLEKRTMVVFLSPKANVQKVRVGEEKIWHFKCFTRSPVRVLVDLSCIYKDFIGHREL